MKHMIMIKPIDWFAFAFSAWFELHSELLFGACKFLFLQVTCVVALY